MKRKFAVCITLILLVTCANGCDNKKEVDKKRGELIIEQTAPELSYDWQEDVDDGLLYASDDGSIVDCLGNPIEEYSYMEVLDNGYISDGQNIAEGCGVDENGQIVNLFKKKGTADEDNFWTGIYEDEDGEELVIVQYGDKAAYEFWEDKETNCSVSVQSISGNLWYFVMNNDGTVSVSSGIGEPWGSFVKISNEAEIDISDATYVEDYEEDEIYDEEYAEGIIGSGKYVEVSIEEILRNPDTYIGQKVTITGEALLTTEGSFCMYDEQYKGITCTKIKAKNTSGESIGYVVDGDYCQVSGTLSTDSFEGIIMQSEKITILDK